MWSIYFAAVVLIPAMNLFATILHLCKLIGTKSSLIHFSVLKNIPAMIPKANVQDHYSKSSKSFRNPTELLDGIRQLLQVWVMANHFPGMVWTEDLMKMANNENNLQHFINYIFNIYSRAVLGYFFLINGITSGKYLFEQINSNKDQSFFKLSARFCLERFLMVAPVFYLYFYSTLYQVQFHAEQIHTQNMTNFCSDAIIPNMLFMSNFVHLNEPVSYYKIGHQFMFYHA